jgi:cytochrome c oxidase subunit II
MKNGWIRMIALAAALSSTHAAFAAQTQAQAAAQRIEIIAKCFSYAPSVITVKKGQPVVLILKSRDVGHGLRVRELNIDMKVKAGGTAEVTFTPDKVGDFKGHCSVFCGSGHGSMDFIVHVVA